MLYFYPWGVCTRWPRTLITYFIFTMRRWLGLWKVVRLELWHMCSEQNFNSILPAKTLSKLCLLPIATSTNFSNEWLYSHTKLYNVFIHHLWLSHRDLFVISYSLISNNNLPLTWFRLFLKQDEKCDLCYLETSSASTCRLSETN